MLTHPEFSIKKHMFSVGSRNVETTTTDSPELICILESLSNRYNRHPKTLLQQHFSSAFLARRDRRVAAAAMNGYPNRESDGVCICVCVRERESLWPLYSEMLFIQNLVPREGVLIIRTKDSSKIEAFSLWSG
jgi:hypothetical protein